MFEVPAKRTKELQFQGKVNRNKNILRPLQELFDDKDRCTEK
jgi:hypothetical protein